jgi:hypothetical protein
VAKDRVKWRGIYISSDEHFGSISREEARYFLRSSETQSPGTWATSAPIVAASDTR